MIITILLLLDQALIESIILTTVFMLLVAVISNFLFRWWIAIIVWVAASNWMVSYGPTDMDMIKKFGLDFNRTVSISRILVSGYEVAEDILMKIDPDTACGKAEAQVTALLADKFYFDPREISLNYNSFHDASPYQISCNYSVTVSGKNIGNFGYLLESWETPK